LRQGTRLEGLSWGKSFATKAKVSIVIDSSVALTWCFEDEASPEADMLLERVCDNEPVVPALWHLELANVFLLAGKRGRITTGEVTTRLELIVELPITTDHETAARTALSDCSGAAEALTAYDAAYLKLAIRRGLPLSSRDEALSGAEPWAAEIGGALAGSNSSSLCHLWDHHPIPLFTCQNFGGTMWYICNHQKIDLR